LLALLALSVFLLFQLRPLWLLLLDAAFLAFVFTQLAYIIHDAGHRQILGSPRQNDIVMLLVGGLVGSSRSWWFESHNRHHSEPNNLDLDPNVALPILAFSEQQARERQGLLRMVTRFQAYYFFPLLTLEALGVRVAGIRGLLTGKSTYPLAEALGIGLHLLLYAALLFSALPVGQALLFILVNQGLAGLYMGLVFAPNHKGMLVADPANRLDFLQRQILSSRNIKPSPLVDFLYGGLNYQIEHHLFPTIPQNKLHAARTVVREFCDELSIPYHETSVGQAYWEVARYFHRMAAPLRQQRSTSEGVDVRGRLLRPADEIVTLAATHVERVEVASEPGPNVLGEREATSSPGLGRPAY